MGALTLIPGTRVYVDTVVVIYSIERIPEYNATLETLWKTVESGAIEIVTSELTLLECLVGPLKNGDARLLQAFEQALMGPDISLLPITQSVLREAARLRATAPAIRTPDAIHASTALTSGCSLFLTNDFGLQTVAGLKVAVLRDLLLP